MSTHILDILTIKVIRSILVSYLSVSDIVAISSTSRVMRDIMPNNLSKLFRRPAPQCVIDKTLLKLLDSKRIPLKEMILKTNITVYLDHIINDKSFVIMRKIIDLLLHLSSSHPSSFSNRTLTIRNINAPSLSYKGPSHADEVLSLVDSLSPLLYLLKEVKFVSSETSTCKRNTEDIALKYPLQDLIKWNVLNNMGMFTQQKDPTPLGKIMFFGFSHSKMKCLLRDSCQADVYQNYFYDESDITVVCPLEKKRCIARNTQILEFLTERSTAKAASSAKPGKHFID